MRPKKAKRKRKRCFGRTEFLGRSDDAQIVLQPAHHGAGDGHGTLPSSESATRAKPSDTANSQPGRLKYLQRVKGRLVPTQLVRHRGQEAVVGHHGLQKKKKRGSEEHGRACSRPSPPLGYLGSRVSEEETAGSVSAKDKDKWTKGHPEPGRPPTLNAAHVFFA